MSLAQIQGWIAQNKTMLGVAGAAAVGGLALVQRNKAKSDAGPNTPPATYSATRSAASTGGQPTAGYPVGYAAPYDSTASDIYNALQPQIEYLQRLSEQQANQATPVPQYKEGGFFARAGSGPGGALYQYRNGRIDFIESGTAAKQLGANSKNITYLSKDDTFWSLPKAGA